MSIYYSILNYLDFSLSSKTVSIFLIISQSNLVIKSTNTRLKKSRLSTQGYFAMLL